MGFLVDRLLDRTFANAGLPEDETRAAMSIGALRVANDGEVRSVVAVDNGFAGPKLIVLTTRALFIIDRFGDVFARHSMAEITKIAPSWGLLAITYELRNGMEMHHRFNLADKAGAYELESNFDALSGR